MAAVTPPFASRKGGSLEIPLHGARADPDMPRDGGDRPPLAVQSPDVLIHGLPSLLALGRALLCRHGGTGEGIRDRDSASGQRDGLLA